MHFCRFLYLRLSFGSVSRRNANLFNMVLTYYNFSLLLLESQFFNLFACDIAVSTPRGLGLNQ